MQKIYDDHSLIYIEGRPMFNIRSAYNIDNYLMGGTSSELQNVTNKLYEGAGAYRMEPEQGIAGRSDQLGSNPVKNGTCTAEVQIRIAMETLASGAG
ncbi:hypothetical protein DPMN_096862 [Dreissena polymorpha]|uniref:Uncharacterized protein n=1 Tax=Dreissena polymorpha TaxID=45954 RepID=A0A9D4R5U2_DREPO|nr:hypothetical protein DPMN_096862 [Dreissena polymorpha]